MPDPAEQFAAWNRAAYDAVMGYAQASLASAEHLLRLNLETARATLEHAAKVARDLMAAGDPRELASLRVKLAQDNLQQAATYAQSVYAIVSQAQLDLGKLFEEQIARIAKELAAGADTIGRGMPGADLQSAALKSTLAATTAMMESLNRATRQFAELSEATMRAAAAQMVKGSGKD